MRPPVGPAVGARLVRVHGAAAAYVGAREDARRSLKLLNSCSNAAQL